MLCPSSYQDVDCHVCLAGLAAAADPIEPSAIPAVAVPAASATQPDELARSTKSGRRPVVTARAAESAAQNTAAKEGTLFDPLTTPSKPLQGVKRKRGRPRTSGLLVSQGGDACSGRAVIAAAKATEAATRVFLEEHLVVNKAEREVRLLKSDSNTRQRTDELFKELTQALRPGSSVSMSEALRKKMTTQVENLRLMVGALPRQG